MPDPDPKPDCICRFNTGLARAVCPVHNPPKVTVPSDEEIATLLNKFWDDLDQDKHPRLLDLIIEVRECTREATLNEAADLTKEADNFDVLERQIRRLVEESHAKRS